MYDVQTHLYVKKNEFVCRTNSFVRFCFFSVFSPLFLSRRILQTNLYDVQTNHYLTNKINKFLAHEKNMDPILVILLGFLDAVLVGEVDGNLER